MKLKKLEINGFKSFNEKAVIDFPPGISAIVGPNGCGKSNIVDALRWVMGEQSLKQLRGKTREDIIFSGANGNPPLNMAEVNLTIANDNGSAPKELREFSEIMLTRRLYRSGESGYFLNKQPCRLKDIYNVFLGSGMGSKSYSVIQQGNIGLITEAGPEERRVFLEEAAGTTRYKARKTEAIRKIESTKQNLLRVNDITTEIKRHINSLKRQAQKALRYKKYRSHLRDLDITLGLHEFDTFTLKTKKIDALLKSLKDTDTEQTTRLKQVDAAIEEIKFKRGRKSEVIVTKKSKIFENRRDSDRLENELKHTESEIDRLGRECADLESTRETLDHNIKNMNCELDAVEKQRVHLKQEIKDGQTAIDLEESASQGGHLRLTDLNTAHEKYKSDFMELVTQEARYKNIYQNAANNKENLRRRLKRKVEEEVLARQKVDDCQNQKENTLQLQKSLEKKIQALNAQVETAEHALNEKSRQLTSMVKKTKTIEFDRTKAASKHVVLKRMKDNFEWYKDGVKAIMKAYGKNHCNENPGGETRDDRAPVAAPNGLSVNIIDLMADVINPEPSFETAVEAVLGEKLQYVLVENQGDGKAAISYLQDNSAGRGGFIPMSSIKPISVDVAPLPDHTTRLLNHLSVKTGFERIADALLRHVVVTDTLSEAVELFNQNGKRQTIVTKSGNVVSPHGVMIGGSKENLSGILTKKKELKDTEEQIDALDKNLAEAHVNQHQMESEVLEIEKEFQQLITARQQASREEIEAEKASYKASEDLKNALRYLEIIELEQEQLMGESVDMDEEISKFNKAIADISQKVQTAQDHVTQTSRQITIEANRLKVLDQKRVDLKLKHTSLSAQLENSNNSLKRLKDFQNDAVSRQERLTKDISGKTKKKAKLERNIVTFETSLSRMYANLKQLEKSLEQDEANYQTFDTYLRENESIISDIRGKREEISRKIRLLELDQSQYNVKRENIVHRFSERYHAPLSELRKELENADDDRKVAMTFPMDRIKNQIQQYKQRIEKIGEINLGAITEYEELKKRYDFLLDQRKDLEDAMESLKKVIRKINRITQKRFLNTFELVNEKLKDVFPRLFSGGTAKLVLTEPDRPLETGVEFMIQPPGKKTMRITLLSGGEKALSAIAFIFSIFLIKPASFCLLDEIDAPLDELNIYRFNDLMKLIGEKSQVLMITHNKRSMEFADTLFGVTMEKKGISKVVSVNFDTSQQESSK